MVPRSKATSSPKPFRSLPILSLRPLRTMMTNDLEVHVTYRITHERPVVARMVLRSETGRAVASSACLQSCGVKLLDLVNICVAYLSGV